MTFEERWQMADQMNLMKSMSKLTRQIRSPRRVTGRGRARGRAVIGGRSRSESLVT